MSAANLSLFPSSYFLTIVRCCLFFFVKNCVTPLMSWISLLMRWLFFPLKLVVFETVPLLPSLSKVKKKEGERGVLVLSSRIFSLLLLRYALIVPRCKSRACPPPFFLFPPPRQRDETPK